MRCGPSTPFTGFVRFGYRDYDPAVGRFTAKDPARDLRGDGDLWDYCVDDPVSCIDPEGLKGESAAEDDYSWIRKNVFWWTLPHSSPEFKKRFKSLDYSMNKSLREFGNGIIYLDEMTPSIQSIGLSLIPGYNRPSIYDKE